MDDYFNKIKTDFLNNYYIKKNPFDSIFNKHVEYEINLIFPSLKKIEKDLLTMMTLSLLTLIFFRFNFTLDEFYKQFTKPSETNSFVTNQDIKMVITLLVPYIKDNNNYELYKSISTLSDISTKKVDDKYICNVQYDRFFAKNESDIKDFSNIEEYKWNIIDLYNNYIASFYTIYKCAHKLFCNWKYIIPLTLENFKQSRIYNKTINVNSFSDFLSSNGNYSNNFFINSKTYGGIDIRDHYHVLINDLYLDVLPYKWLMYEKYDKEVQKEYIYLELIIEHFGDIFNARYKTKENTELFIDKLDLLFNFAQDPLKMSKYRDLLYQILLHFDIISYEYNEKITKVTKTRESMNILEEELVVIDKEEELKKLIENYYVNPTYDNKKIYFENIYQYLIDTIYQFSFTWYGKNIISYDSLGKIQKIKYLNEFEINNEKIFNLELIPNSYVSYKNIYNFAKSLLFYKKKVHEIKDWDSLLLETRRLILDRLNTNDSWFNIKGNLRRKYEDLFNDSLNDKIYIKIKQNLINLTFHCLITRGLLSEINFSGSIDKVIESFDGYYFVTQKKYSSLNPYMKENGEKTTFTNSVVNAIKNPQKQSWVHTFALNWIQQIHFYKHFLNQRVIYITGGTGVGKSTQSPKLLWYGLFLTGNYNGKVVNTQPRTNAATGNAKFIGEEMGINLEEYIDKKMEKTTNYFIQYNTQLQKHDMNSLGSLESYLPKVKSYLKLVTDGVLLNNLLESPILKKLDNNQKNTKYNMYDVIAIDEAHEHNQNMDMILTLMRDTGFINNSLKLIIITATIEEDEPRYRQYFKNINDNLLYPLNNTLYQYNILDSEILSNIINIYKRNDIVNFDRISLDRRIHISPPLLDTSFEIEEIYLPEDTNNYKEAEELGIKKAIELTKNTDGDILFFSTSENSIKNIVNTINNSNIPNNWIALPYYSKLPDRFKNIIENIDSGINIDFPKKELFNVLNGENYNKINFKYTRAIIVATNVAEASITIASLKVVIETGYQVSVSYDDILNSQNVEIVKITETSRLQRKGRVGRKSNGTVYYMYKKGSREKIKKIFPITQQLNQLIYTLCDLIKEGYVLDDNNEEKLDEYILPFLTNGTLNNLSEIDNFLGLQYVYDYYTNEYFSKEYVANTFLRNHVIEFDIENENEDKIKSILSFRFIKGYDIKTILDEQGKFFLIHPFEGIMEREPLTGYFKPKNLEVLIKRFKGLFNKLFKLRLVIEDDNQFFLTKLFTILKKLKNDISRFIPNINYDILWLFILAKKYDLFNETVWCYLITQLSSIENMSMKYTNINNKEKPNTTLIYKNFSDGISDLHLYTNIFNNIKKILPKIEYASGTDLLLEKNKLKLDKNYKSVFEKSDLALAERYERRNAESFALLKVVKNKKNIDYTNLTYWCDSYGLDYREIIRLYNEFLNINFENYVEKWVNDFNDFIPYFPENKSLIFIFISVFGFDNLLFYSSAGHEQKIDSNVTGNILHYIKADTQQVPIENIKNVDLSGANEMQYLIAKRYYGKEIHYKHVSRFNFEKYTKAIVPELLFNIKNMNYNRKTLIEIYNNLDNFIIGEYLLPEYDKTTVKKTDDIILDSEKNRIFNTTLLTIINLIKERIS